MKDDKLQILIDILKKMGSAVLAYSGGVDSTLLLKALKLSGIRVLAMTATSKTMPEHDLIYAKNAVEEIGIEHLIVKTDELKNRDFKENSPDRCFFCKDELFGKLREVASNRRYEFVIDGSNLDDRKDRRPGKKAALKHGVRSPLEEAGLNKKDIRDLSRKLKLPAWNRPSSPCLASRFPYGEPITVSALERVAKAEGFIKSLGFVGFRVRHHKDIARIELNEKDMRKILKKDIREKVAKKLKSLGYDFISLDLEGFRSGRMNEALNRDSDATTDK